jgi:H+-translocating NAD(P) transhydrogenase subunit alpha
MIEPKTKSLAIKWDDELIKATLLTKDGALVHPSFKAGS